MPFDVCNKNEQKPITIIRAASGYELTKYEKEKLANIEDNAQENRIETIKLNNEVLPISDKKEVEINLGSLASKNKISAEDLADNTFFINCELSDDDLTKR
jgi:hypothetical protein